MSNTRKIVRSFVNAVAQENYADAGKLFTSALNSKISAALDAKRIDVAGSIVGGLRTEETLDEMMRTDEAEAVIARIIGMPTKFVDDAFNREYNGERLRSVLHPSPVADALGGGKGKDPYKKTLSPNLLKGFFKEWMSKKVINKTTLAAIKKTLPYNPITTHSPEFWDED